MFAGAATAQESLYNNRDFKITDFDEIPEEAIEDAERFFAQCQADYHHSSHYDCECQAMRYLEARILRGPEADSSVVMLDVQDECPNKAGAAGFAYTGCIEKPYNFLPKNLDPEEYCSCVGNTYAEYYARVREPPTSQVIVTLQAQAMSDCRNRL